MCIEFELPFPVSVNQYYRSQVDRRGRVYATRSKAAKDYRKVVKQALKNFPTLTDNVHISLILCPPDKRKRDLDNYDGKALWDSLTHAGVWKDDSQVKSRYSEWGETIKGGKAFIKISRKTAKRQG